MRSSLVASFLSLSFSPPSSSSLSSSSSLLFRLPSAASSLSALRLRPRLLRPFHHSITMSDITHPTIKGMLVVVLYLIRTIQPPLHHHLAVYPASCSLRSPQTYSPNPFNGSIPDYDASMSAILLQDDVISLHTPPTRIYYPSSLTLALRFFLQMAGSPSSLTCGPARP